MKRSHVIETTKEMWDKLKVIYEGTEHVKQNLASLLVYELFKMKDGEFIKETFARFEKVIGELKVVGKKQPVADQITKILRSFPS